MRCHRRHGATALIAVLATSPSLVAAWQPSDWTLNSTKLNRTAWENQPYVSNGYIGQRLPAGEGGSFRATVHSVPPLTSAGSLSVPALEGFGYLQSIPTGERLNTQGWPLFTPRQTAATVAGFYDQQYVLFLPVPHRRTSAGLT